MSIASNAGAQAAAEEIQALVRKKMKEHADKPDVLRILKEIEEEAGRIVETARLGWY